VLDVESGGPGVDCRSCGNASTDVVKPKSLHAQVASRYRRSTRTRTENRKLEYEHDCIARSGIIKTH